MSQFSAADLATFLLPFGDKGSVRLVRRPRRWRWKQAVEKQALPASLPT